MISGTSLFSLWSESVSVSDVGDFSEHSEQFLVSSERSARNATTVSSKVSDLVNSGDVSISISDVGSNSKLSEHGVSICEKGTAPGFKLLASGVDEPLVSSGVSSWKDLVLLLVCTPATCDDEAPGVNRPSYIDLRPKDGCTFAPFWWLYCSRRHLLTNRNILRYNILVYVNIHKKYYFLKCVCVPA